MSGFGGRKEGRVGYGEPGGCACAFFVLWREKNILVREEMELRGREGKLLAEERKKRAKENRTSK